MKKILFIVALLAVNFVHAAETKTYTISEQTTVTESNDYVILVSTDDKMIDCIDNTTEVYLIFSIITTDKDGTRTGKFYYLKQRSAYVVTRAYSIQSF